MVFAWPSAVSRHLHGIDGVVVGSGPFSLVRVTVDAEHQHKTRSILREAANVLTERGYAVEFERGHKAINVRKVA